jgi:hypothetical protein
VGELSCVFLFLVGSLRDDGRVSDEYRYHNEGDGLRGEVPASVWERG